MPNRYKRATYKEIPDYLQRCQPFVGNSMHAKTAGIDHHYRVYSYADHIASVSANFRWIAKKNGETTKTTVRAINLCHTYLPEKLTAGIDIPEVDQYNRHYGNEVEG